MDILEVLPVSIAEPLRMLTASRTPLSRMEQYQSVKTVVGMSSQTLYSLVKAWCVLQIVVMMDKKIHVLELFSIVSSFGLIDSLTHLLPNKTHVHLSLFIFIIM
mmetsp:Transcript_14851/g.36001  ORF Transcript_14851/g.36001 Transcript_14851/m.36001 type:complete len:104 (+) Transcript_14851:620-931(+)